MRLHKDDLRAIVAAIRWGQPGYEALEDAFLDADEVFAYGARTAKPEAPNDQVNAQINDGRIIDAVIEKPEAPAPKPEHNHRFTIHMGDREAKCECGFTIIPSDRGYQPAPALAPKEEQ